MSRAPGAWSVVGSGHKNQLRIRWTKHKSIRVATDFVFPSRPLLPTGAGVWADIQSSPGDGIQEFGFARVNHQPVDILVESRKLFPSFSRVPASQQSADFNRGVNRVGVVGVEVDVLDVSYMRRSGKTPLRHTGHRPKRRHFAPVTTEIVAGEQMRWLGAGEQPH